MALSAGLRNRLIAVAGAIATVFLGGQDGVERREYTPYKDVAGVWTVCDGHTVRDIGSEVANGCTAALENSGCL